jgi:flagella basal body P-ring formation protein FlgA
VLTDLGVEETARRALSGQFNLSPDDLNVKLLSPFFGSWLPQTEPETAFRIELMPSPQLPLGRSQLTVRILDGERVIAARPASFEITRRQSVVVALSSLERSQVVTAESIREEMRYVDAPVDRLTAQQVIGHKVAFPLRPEEIITLRHLGEEAVEETPVLVQAREPVRLIARKGVLKVTVPVAEALQSGKKGQVIRVRNLQSNQIVAGVVTGRGEVEVPLN